MKTAIALPAILLVVGAFGNAATAQTKPGYWIVETNAKTKDYSIVRFYADTHVQMHEQHLEGVYLDITRRRVRRQLDAALNAAARHWVVVRQPGHSRYLAGGGRQ